MPLQCNAVPGVRLMLQLLLIQGETFNLVVPADIDAIMDNYIALGPLLPQYQLGILLVAAAGQCPMLAPL